MSCSLDRTKSDMIKKGHIDINDVLKDKSATGINNFHRYELALINFSKKKFGELDSKPFLPLTSNKVQFNPAFFDKVDRLNEEEEKTLNNDLEDFKKIGKEIELTDEEKSEKLRLEQEEIANKLFEEAMNTEQNQIDKKLRTC